MLLLDVMLAVLRVYELAREEENRCTPYAMLRLNACLGCVCYVA